MYDPKKLKSIKEQVRIVNALNLKYYLHDKYENCYNYVIKLWCDWLEVLGFFF